MADYTFYTNPKSRGQIARWALHEVDADYDQVLVDWKDKSPQFLAVNPMGKVPTLVHHLDDGDRVVTEAAAICLYLAEMHPEAGLLPNEGETADYLRWTFFAAGPVEQAITSQAMGWTIDDPSRGRMLGFGDFERPLTVLGNHLEGRDYVCGPRFTAADVYVGSQVLWGTQFGTLPKLDSFVAYAERLGQREAYRRGKEEDNQLIAEMQAAG
jgi:glutathione S-transferase